MADVNYDAANGHTNGYAANGNSNTLMQNASAAYKSVADGPLVQNVKDQHAKTADELSALAASRRPPSHGTATGQPLTHYHSFFSELLSWNNPRASAIAYSSIVAFIFATRYLDILRYGFKLTWMVLGATVAAEFVGKAALGNGFATQLRPRNYYTVPKETLNAVIGDVHELVNFFVIEAQRIVFAENLTSSATTAAAAFLSYFLAKVMPYWGLAVLFTTLAFFVPLVYTSNQELIDNAMHQATEVVNAQTTQLREVASKHTAQAADITKQYVGDYTAKAQNLLHRRSVSPETQHKFPAAPSDLPLKSAPTHEPVAEVQAVPVL
jgi:hypothetical protein